MWKLIIKNIWCRRRRNGWLFAELVLVSVVTWIIMDPVIVLTHDLSLPLGYDANRLCLIDVATRSQQSALYDSLATDSASVVGNYFRLVGKVKTRSDVEQATPILSFTYLNSLGNSTGYFKVDTLQCYAGFIWFLPGHHFFETYGIKAAEGSGSAEELSKAVYGANDVVVTCNLVENQFQGKQVKGQTIYTSFNADTTYYRIAGVAENVRNRSFWRPYPMVFVPDYFISSRIIRGGDAKILVRLKPGISPEKFISDFRPWMVKNMKAGNQFARAVQSYPRLLQNMEYTEGTSNKVRLNIALSVFFGISLCLGVIGTFWLQTRKRSEEAGVMRSFGATPSYIMRLLLGEGVVLTTVAFLLGCFLYLQYAWKEGLYNGASWMEIKTSYWVSSFGPHFCIVSGIVYFLLLTIVLIGIWIPAYGISHTSPVDALRDE